MPPIEEEEDLLAPEPAEDHEGFHFYGQPIRDDAFADYLIRKIQSRKDDLKSLKAWYETQYAAAEARITSQNDNDLARLNHYFNQLPHAATKTGENYKLPSGKLFTRQQEPDWDYKTGNDEAVRWLKANHMPDKVKIKETVDWAALKHLITLTPDGKVALTETGEVIPGLTGEPRPIKFDYSLNKQQ